MLICVAEVVWAIIHLLTKIIRRNTKANMDPHQKNEC
jgi:hypothetical protein